MDDQVTAGNNLVVPRRVFPKPGCETELLVKRLVVPVPMKLIERIAEVRHRNY
jgi:hypothetical protein